MTGYRVEIDRALSRRIKKMDRHVLTVRRKATARDSSEYD